MRINIILISLTLLFIAPTAQAQKKVNFGGTNHWIYAYGTADGHNTGNSWYLPAQNLRPTVAHYHLSSSTVDAQISGLKNSGQNAYVIFIWNKNIGSCEFTSCNDGVADGTWGEVIDNSWSVMRPQHRTNLKAMIGKALDVGFNRIYIRFGYNSSPSSWSSWNEASYQQAWNFIVDARAAAIEVVNSKGLSAKLAHPYNLLMFDLGAEDGGLTGGQRPAFMQRLWSDYAFTFGIDDTVGFSFAWSPGRFANNRTLLQATGILPKHWAFDIYSNVGSSLGSIYNEMGDLRNQPVHLLETYFNNSLISSQISGALVSNDLLNIQLIAQWPLYSGMNHGHFSKSAVDSQSSTTTFSNYSSLLSNRQVHISSSNSNLLSIKDINCAATTTWPCSVRLGWPKPPAGKRYGIYINTPAGTSLVACEAIAGQTNINWISMNPSYVFDLYEINGTACAHPTPNPGAVKRAVGEATPYGY